MRNKKPLIASLFIVLALIGGRGVDCFGADRLQADGQPISLQQANDGSQQNRPNDKPDPSPPDKETQKPKQPVASESLKPFTPSEKIKADQAVDFPYDI